MITRGVHAPPATVCFLLLAAMLSLTGRAAGQDASAGKGVFARRCSGCHAPDANKEGPLLRGVLDRRAGTAPGFQYSDALRNSGIVWNESLIAKWLENPQAVVANNDMEFRVRDADERAAVIAYLKSLPN